jgi:hypothetical protein
MTTEKSPDEVAYEEKSHRNSTLSGFGFETEVHVPCPFCAEPDFIVHPITDPETAYARGAVCGSCGRGMRALVTRSKAGVSFELVQTAGDDPPAWLVPALRRV